MRSLLCLTAVILISGHGLAAEPAVEVRVRSLNDLLTRAEYLGGLVNQAEAARQGVEFVRSLADVGGPRGIEGIDPSRPFGLYASVTKDVVNSPVVLMVPLASEEAFLDLLKAKVNLEPKKTENGVYEVAVPGVPVPVFFRFANRYIYATAQSEKGIDESNLIESGKFFLGRDDSIASVKLHIDRIPADVRDVLFGQFELKLNDLKDEDQGGESPATRKLKAFALDQVGSIVHSLITQGKTLSVRFMIEPKTDDLVLEVDLAPTSGTSLARAIQETSGSSTAARAMSDIANPVAGGSIYLALPESVRGELSPIIDDLVKEAIARTDANERPGVRMTLEAVAPTLKAGILDAAFKLTASDDKLRLTAGLKVAEGGGIEKTLKTFAPFLPEDRGKVEFDVKKAGGLPIHRMTSPDPNLKAVFGSSDIWLATGNDLLLLSIEPDGEALTAVAGSAAKPIAVRPFTAEVSVARLLAFSEKALPPETLKRLTAQVFPGSPAGKDVVKLTVGGGRSLKARLAIKGSAVRLAVMIDQEKKK